MTRIVYLHGFASSPASSKARYFRDLLERAGAEVAVPDLAEGDFEHLTITGQLAVIDRTAGTGPVDLIGSSMGGYLAAHYAATHNNVRKLVLLAPAFGFPHRWADRLGAAAVEEWKRRGIMDVFHYAEGRNRKLGYQLLLDGAQYEDDPDFRQPALIFHGKYDDTVPVTYSLDFAATHSNVHLEVLDSGHDLLNVLEYMGAKTVDFLKSSQKPKSHR